MFAAILLLLVVVVYRVGIGFASGGEFHDLQNFAPVAAIALCGAVYLPRRLAVVLPLAMLFASDLILNVFFYHWPMLSWDILPRYAALALISVLGLALRDRARTGTLLAASAVGSIAFYLITNTGSWLAEPRYAKTFAGWLQALTKGLPGYAPTWTFYRHTLISDLLFTALFIGCMHWQAKKNALPASEPLSA